MVQPKSSSVSFALASDHEALEVLASAVSLGTGNYNAPAANTAAVIQYSGTATYQHVIGGIAWSYSGTPTAGAITIAFGSPSVEAFGLDVANKGVGYVPFRPPQYAPAGDDVTISLSAGGSGVTGKLNVVSHWRKAV